MNNFNLIGFVKVGNIGPGFVEPVFEKDSKYYFQQEFGNKIKNFVPTKLPENNCIFLESAKLLPAKIGSQAFYAIQTNDSIFYGNLSKMHRYIFA